jgi:TolB protein
VTAVSGASAGSNSSPSWSPDGGKLVYTAAPPAGSTTAARLVTANRDGSELQPVRGTAAPYVADAAWSPDGKWIAYTRSKGGDTPSSVYIVPAHGGTARRVAAGWNPGWSPDARRLIFIQGKSPCCDHLVTSDLHGGHRQIIATDGGTEEYFSSPPTWSPDGVWIAYSMEGREDAPHIAILPAIGGQPQTAIPWARNPAWAPPVTLPDGPRPPCPSP